MLLGILNRTETILKFHEKMYMTYNFDTICDYIWLMYIYIWIVFIIIAMY